MDTKTWQHKKQKLLTDTAHELKTLANQIQQYMKRNMRHDQAGFIPDIQDWFDIWKLYHQGKEQKSYNRRIWQNPASIHDFKKKKETLAS